MRLATLACSGGGSVAAVLDGDGTAFAVEPFADVGALLGAGPAGAAAVGAVLAAAGAGVAPAQQRLLRPVLAPGVVVCVGLNFGGHIVEMGRELPSVPTLFSKPARALVDPCADVVLPGVSERVDYEGELAVVIGTAARCVERADAWAHVGGLTLMNDVSARDLQRRSSQWFAGKALEASTPFGPWVVTPDEVPDLAACELVTTVNGEERQRASLGDLLFDVPALVADVSRIFTLRPGDVIATGTPGGVGDASGRYLGDGDVVEVSVEGIGTLRTVFRAGRGASAAPRPGASGQP